MIALRLLLVGFISTWTSLHGADAPVRPKQDASRNPIRYAPTGGHTITPDDWKAFLDFAVRHLRPEGG